MTRQTLCTCLLLASLAGGAAADVMFVYKFEPGTSQRYRLQLNTEMKMSGMDATQKADMTVKVTCAAADQERYTMHLLFEKVEATNTIAGTPQADASATKMTGKTVNFVVDRHGSVSGIAPGPGFDVWPQVQQVVEPTLKNWYVYMPARSVAVGGEWKRENHRDESTAGAEYVTNEHFAFRETRKEKRGEVAVVDQDVTTTIGGTTETPVGVFKLAGGGTGKFEFLFHPGSGSIRHFKGTMNTNVDMTPQAGGMAMKTTVANHIERTLLE